jgi:ATP-dependent DNA helicase RecG
MPTVGVERAFNLPPLERGKALLAVSEDQWFDRKSSRIGAQDLANVLIGMANADGGVIVIGLHNRKVEGVDRSARQITGWQQATIDFTTPVVRCRPRLVDCIREGGDEDRLLVFDVDPSDRVHANQRDEVYLRVGDENRRLNFAQRQELMFDKGQSAYEATPLAATYPADLDERVLQSYADSMNHPDLKRLLAARGLLTRQDELTVAAVLLFAESPQRWLPEAFVRILRYRGQERGSGSRQELLDDIRIEGPVPFQLAEARRAILDRLPSRRALSASGRFERVGLLPQDAWLEALVNAVVHRSYSIAGDHIRVEIFDDRVEIESPGRFPGIADARDPLQVTRFARNPRIARVAADLHFGQELGEGIRRMFEEMRLAGLADPDYFQTSGSVRVTLLAAPVDRALEARLPPGSRDLVRAIREAGRVSTGDLVEVTGRSRPQVLRMLHSLQEAHIIEWVGNSPKDPRAHWRLYTV